MANDKKNKNIVRTFLGSKSKNYLDFNDPV